MQALSRSVVVDNTFAVDSRFASAKCAREFRQDSPTARAAKPPGGELGGTEIIPKLPDPNIAHLLGIDPSGVCHLPLRAAGTRTEKSANLARLNRYQPCYERSGMGRIFQMQFPGR